MELECSGKIYKFSDGMEVVAPPLTVGDYLALASEKRNKTWWKFARSILKH